MEQILAAATDLFSKYGFLGTTTQQLADAVGLVKGTLYYHIGSKEELLFRIHQVVTEEGIRRWAGAVEDLDSDTRVVLRQMIAAHCEIIDRYRNWVTVFSEELKFLSPPLLDQVVERRDVYTAMLETVIVRGVDRGELHTERPRASTLMILGMLNSVHRWYQPGGKLNATRLADIVSEVVLRGIARH
jgi:AcrR family transcriptional regulator